ncbi:MAG: hypothetical protein ACYSWT_14895 [Planctomycetota bacterium]|jgi:hypothetical protein
MTASLPHGPRPILTLPVVACGVILVAAAIGLQPALAAVIQKFSKQPIALRQSLDDFDVAGLQSFRPVLRRDLYEELYRHIPLTSVGTEDVIRLVVEPRLGADPDSTADDLTLLVSYYSDPRDTVAHTPEICYRQGGSVVRSIEVVDVEVPGLETGPEVIAAKMIEFTPVLLIGDEAVVPDPEEGWRQAVIYTFVCNGGFYADREQLRWVIGTPGDKYTYFSKVEVGSTSPPEGDFEATRQRCKLLLGEALAVLANEHFPTKAQVRGRP